MLKLFKVRLLLVLAFFSISFSGLALAAPKVSLEVLAEKDVVVLDKKGKVVLDKKGNEVTKRVVTTETIPGETLFYTIKYNNSGDEAAKNVQLDNPIPEGTAYKNQSATGENSEILFSIDAGKTFKTAANLTYETKDEKGKVKTQEATPEQYNAIRWVIADIPSKSKGSVGFSVIVK